MDDRAVSPVVGKALEATLVVLYLGLVTASLYGGAVPDYRTAAGQEVAERTASSAAIEIQDAVPPETAAGQTRVDIEPPATIAGEAYRLSVEDGRLRLDHPKTAVSTSVPLVLPDRVVDVSGTCESGGSSHVRVTTTDGGLVVRLE